MVQLLFDWDEENIVHIGRHDITPFEVEEVMRGRSLTFPAKTVQGENRNRLLGKTAQGRYLVVVYTLRNNRIRPITAHPMHRSERSRYAAQIE